MCSALFKYKTLIAGVLIKDWTGVKCNLTTGSLLGGPTTNTGILGGGKKNNSNVTWYNYVLERAQYPKWQSLVDSLERRGISVGLYLSPYVEEIPMHLRSGRRYLFEEVQQDDYFVKKKRNLMAPSVALVRALSRMGDEEEATKTTIMQELEGQ